VTGTSGTWFELSTWADNEAIESVAELLARFGYNEGVSIEQPFLQEQDGDNLTIDTSKPAVIRAYVPSESFDPAIVEQVRNGLWHLGQMRSVGELTLTERREEDWAEAWKEHYRPMRASDRVVIRPPWFDYSPQPDDIVLVLDPGMAFGTGLHPTTRLSLYQIEQYVTPGCSFFDVGTGSGILSLAASRLGASPVHAVDIDPMSVRVAQGNLDHNAATALVTLAVGSADWAAGHTYDVVLANIIARVLISISSDLRAAVGPGGLLLLSGIIEPKEVDTREVFEGLNLDLIGRNQIEDWVSLTFLAPE
jgi:ribosomal protein L11 methyltransferase